MSNYIYRCLINLKMRVYSLPVVLQVGRLQRGRS